VFSGCGSLAVARRQPAGADSLNGPTPVSRSIPSSGPGPPRRARVAGGWEELWQPSQPCLAATELDQAADRPAQGW